MPRINFITALTALSTVIALLLFFAMDRVTRYLLRVRLILPCQPVLLEPFKVLPGAMRCDKMQKKLLGRSTNEISSYCRVLNLFWSV